MLENVIIIGCGPASYVAGIYNATANHSPLILEEITSETYNFQASNKIPAIPENLTPQDYTSLCKKQAIRFGVRCMPLSVNYINVEDAIIKIRCAEVTLNVKMCIIDDLLIFRRLFGNESAELIKDLQNKNIYCCGSITEKYKNAIILASSGCKAAMNVNRDLE